MLKKHSPYYILIAIAISILVILADEKIISGKGTWNTLELKTIDLRFLFKKKPEKDVSKDIALILIDDKSYKSLNQPLILYHNHIAKVVAYLVEKRAKIIGLDIELPSISLENKIAGGYESVYARTLLDARKKGTPVVIGFSSLLNAPLQTYLLAAGEENIAAFNLTEDSDAFIRRQKLYNAEGDIKCSAFSYLLAQKFLKTPLAFPQTILIDYSLEDNIAIHSFDDIYRESLQQNKEKLNVFTDKAVILGTSLAFVDKHSTPLASFDALFKSKMTDGALIQAVALNTLLSGSIFHEPGRSLGAFYIFVLTSLTVLLCYERSPFSAALLCALESGVLLLSSVFAFNHFYVLRLIPLLSAILLSLGAITVFRYYTVERKNKKIRKCFAAYVPEKIIDQLLDTDLGKLTEGEQKQVALLFSDIRGFTAFSENNKYNPQKVVHFLNHYHKEMTEIIHRNYGTVSQLTGDGIFAFFGAPLTLADPILAAVKAALEMKEKTVELKQAWQEYGMTDLRIGVGINYGDAIVGNIGSVKKMEYVAIGDNTNIASRIEGLTKEYNEPILMSAAAYACVREKVVARPLGSARIKGHTAVTIFAVDGLL